MGLDTIWEEHGVYQRFSGVVSQFDKETSQVEVEDRLHQGPIKYWIIDTLNIALYNRDEDDAMEAVAMDLLVEEDFDLRGLMMVFVTKDLAHRENISKYATEMRKLGSSWRIGVFDTLDEARAWIAEPMTEGWGSPV